MHEQAWRACAPMSVDEILKSENGDAGASTAHQRRQKEMFVHGKVI